MANEKRLIDAYALIEDIEKRYCKPCKAEGKDYKEVACRACWVDDMILEIDPAPTVDAVEVVRCKDCKRWIANDSGISWQMRGRTDGACQHLMGTHLAERYMTEGEHFCSYGERREGE